MNPQWNLTGLIVSWIITIVCLIYIRLKYKKKIKKQTVTNHEDSAVVINHYDKSDTISYHGKLQEIKSISPYLSVNIDERVLNTKAGYQSNTMVQTNAWYVFMEVYKPVGEDDIYFILFAVNKNGLYDLPPISNLIRSIDIHKDGTSELSVYKDIDY